MVKVLDRESINRMTRNSGRGGSTYVGGGGGGGYTLPLAADGTRGGVQIGFTTDATARKYAVQLDNEKAYVNVPWENTWRPLGTSATDACAGNDSRLSDARPASDVYSWAKAATKPSYNLDEVSDGNTRKLANYLPLSGGTMTGAIKYRNDRSGLFNIGTGTTPSGYTTTTAGGNTQIGVISWDGASDEGGVLVGSDCCVVYNSGDSEYVFKVMDKDVSTDLSGGYSAANCLLAVGQGSGAATYVKNLYSAGYVTALSDARKKRVLGDIVLSAEQIAQMPAVRFEWKDPKKPGMFIGTLAQPWREILPEAVHTLDDGTLSFDYQSAAIVGLINLADEIVAIKNKLKRYGFK